MRVAVLGAGYAGLTLARKLERRLPEDVELLVVEETGYHLLQHELHRVIRRPQFADDVVVPLPEVLDRAEIRTARVERVDPEASVVELAGGESIDYDVAAVCLGAETNFYDLPGVEEHATPLKRIEHAREIRADFFDVVDDGGEVYVGGAGLSGVQVAGELAALAREEDARERVEIALLERFDSVAPSFPENFQRAVRDALAERQVRIETNARVERATADEIGLADGRALEYDQFVWTGGLKGPKAVGGERPEVRSTLRLSDGTFVVGDSARVVDAEGRKVPASAQAAVREARVAAENVVQLVDHAREGDGGFEPRLEPFVFDSPGWIVSVGDGAVAQVGPSVLTGRAAHALKATVGVSYLTSVGAVRKAADLINEEFAGD